MRLASVAASSSAAIPCLRAPRVRFTTLDHSPSRAIAAAQSSASLHSRPQKCTDAGELRGARARSAPPNTFQRARVDREALQQIVHGTDASAEELARDRSQIEARRWKSAPRGVEDARRVVSPRA